VRNVARLGLLWIPLVTAAACNNSTAPPAASTPAATTATVPACAVRGPFDDTSGYYSQFYEDYILSYVFRDVAKGTYVDVGANDPDKATVTKYFYLKGWRGFNIEPNPDMMALIKKSRPEDINVPVGIADKPGQLTFYNFKTVPGISTFDKDIALGHQSRGFKFEQLQIPVFTLNEVLAQHAEAAGHITFLNADVEGFERQVLSSIDFQKYAPIVVMAEATAPDTDNPMYQHWESILIKAGYVFAMDDALNRYYLHPAHLDLLPRFAEVNYCVEMDKIGKHMQLNGYTGGKR
jgi:FkbM family methyltransferase